MQVGLLLHAFLLDQFDQAWKDALLVHHLKRSIVLVVAAVEEEEYSDYVQRGVIGLLLLLAIDCEKERPGRTCSRQYIICRRT